MCLSTLTARSILGWAFHSHGALFSWRARHSLGHGFVPVWVFWQEGAVSLSDGALVRVRQTEQVAYHALVITILAMLPTCRRQNTLRRRGQ